MKRRKVSRTHHIQLYKDNSKNSQNKNIETKQIDNDKKKEESAAAETENLESIKDAPKSNEREQEMSKSKT